MSDEARRREYLQALDIDTYSLRGAAAPEAAAAPDAAVPSDWQGLESAVSTCTRCALLETRTRTVFGVGNRAADWMIVGEAPGQEEDRRGEPFVGRAGQLLDEMLRALGLDRQSVFIANILKCRPPDNRDPGQDEAAACREYLDRQIELVSPRLILAVGRIAAQRLLDSDAPVGRMRGRRHSLGDSALPVIVTYHPAYLLRSPTQKRKTWQDLVLAKQVFDEGGT
mgnify:FL=1